MRSRQHRLQRRQHQKTHRRVELGDAVAAALAVVGITSKRVERWLGRPCRCKRRQEKLNQLDRYVTKILSGDAAERDTARQQLEQKLEK